MVASSVVGPVVRSVVTSAINSGQGGLDPDALAYFAAVEAAGGSFDLSSIDGYDSNFSTGTDGWAGVNAPTIDGNIDGIAGQDNNLRVTAPVGAPYRITGQPRNVGVTYTIQADVYVPSTNSNTNGVYFRGLGDAQKFIPTPNTWQTISATGVAGDVIHQIAFCQDSSDAVDAGGDDVVYIRNIRIRNVAFSAYTESYVKRAHSNLFFGLKRDGLWDKLTELYLLCGKTFGGLTVKAKGSGSLTNVNFVTGDWVGAGSGCGLVGNGSTKYINTNRVTEAVGDSGLSAYITAATTGTFDTVIGIDSSNVNTHHLRTTASTTGLQFTSSSTTDGVVDTFTTGLITANENGTTLSLHQNGVNVTDKTVVNRSLTANNVFIFALSRGNSPTDYGDYRIGMASIHKALTDTDAANLSTRINAFMTALGGNVY